MVLHWGLSWECFQKIARLYSSQGLTGAGSFTPSSLTWLLARDLSHSPHRPLHRVAHNMAAGFPQNEQSKRENNQDRSYSVFYNLISEMTYHHFRHIPVVVYTILVQCGRRMYRAWIPLRVLLEDDYTSYQENNEKNFSPSFRDINLQTKRPLSTKENEKIST